MNSEELAFTSAIDLARAIASRKLSPVEVVENVLERIQRLQPQLNCFTVVLAEEALAQARRAEQQVMAGGALPPLLGVPVTIKDLLMLKGVSYMSGSMIYKDRIADRDAPLVARLKKAGAIIVGKTTTPEFGWKALTDSKVSGVSRNPWNLEHNPGGSSGGAAAAAAAGLAPLNTGGDGAGSIRIPASFCGVFGFKPSFGRVPVYPQGGEMLAHLGPITRTVADGALMLAHTAGPDWEDRLCLASQPDDYLGQLQAGVRGWRVGWSADLGFAERVHPEVLASCQKASRVFEELGAKVEEVSLDWGNPFPIVHTFWRANQAHNLRPYLESHGQEIDPALLVCATEGLELPAADFQDAQAARHLFFNKVASSFEDFDLLLTPSVAEPALPVNTLIPEGYAQHPWDWIRWAPFSFPFNLTHMPAATVPTGFTAGGLPIGLQIVGKRLDDLKVFQAAAAFEQARPWADKRPSL